MIITYMVLFNCKIDVGTVSIFQRLYLRFLFILVTVSG